MFTGDTDSSILDSEEVENYARQMNLTLKVDVFKWPHHGTRNISSSLASKISPKYVVVPNRNGYGAPGSGMKKVFTTIGSKIYEQKDYNSIVIISNGNELNVLTNINISDYKR